MILSIILIRGFMAESEENLNETTKKSVSKTGFYYSFLTIVLLFCLLQIGFGAILNISKTIAYRAKILTLTKIRDTAETNNQILKKDIKQFSSMSSLEGIARNNLKMAGEDEVLIIINQPQPSGKTKKGHKKKKRSHNAGNS